MKLSCPACAAKYSIADEKVQDRLAKIRCRKCSATIIVDGKVSPPNVYTSDGGNVPAADEGDAGVSAAGGGEYSVDFGDNDQRSMSADEIVQACRRGELSPDMFVWAEGFSDWTAIKDVPELAGAVGGGGGMAPRAAARSGSGRGSATDLFGGIETAGSEDEVMTSAPHAGGGGGAPAAQMAPATGARNESSVLFSLSALTASAPAAPSPSKPIAAPSVTNGKDDDSGLIDLKALTSAVSNQAPASPLALGTAPLGMAAPLGGMTAPAIAADGPMPKQQSSKTGLYIGGAVVLVGAMIAGAIVVTGNKEPPPAPVAVAAPAPTAAPAPAPEPKKEEPTAAPPATGTAEPEAAKDSPTKTASTTKAPSAAVAHVASRPKSSSGSSGASAPAPAEKPAEKASSSSSSSDDAPKPKKKKEKTCNCSPGDLMCAMKCAAT
ncbi:MAG TPA: zinc-ribbon domain-containing protein [Polyangiaceae bacterium]|nr:zinc-ribbon domain-containing protein [Polyangiaceae bacterium]